MEDVGIDDVQAALFGSSGTAVGEKIYVQGGCDNNSIPFRTSAVDNTESNEWRRWRLPEEPCASVAIDSW